jgi:hypothetical protein
VVEWLFGKLNPTTKKMTEGQFVKALQDCGKKQGLKLLILSMEDYNSEVSDKLDSLCSDSRYLRLEGGAMIFMT